LNALNSRLLADNLQANGDQTSTAIAYQIAFDLYDNGTQEFLAKVIQSLPVTITEAPTEEANRRSTRSNIV
jgi:hypothetical protein